MDMKTKRCGECLQIFPAPMVFRPMGLVTERWCAACALKVAAKMAATAPGVAADLIREATAILAKCSISYQPGRVAVNSGERGI